MNWTKEEVLLIVADYFEMLLLERQHQPFNKRAHRTNLIFQLNNRSEGSVEFKHQNISAALINMGLPYIDGYKPRFNYQRELLEKEIADYIKKNRANLETNFQKFADERVPPIGYHLTQEVLEKAPISSNFSEREPLYRPVRINYLEREQNNRSLGEEGEKFAIEFEKKRLIDAGKDNLIDKIEWVSKELGDGLGFDILSRNENGTDRFIEVKTTKLAKETPIYLSRTEVNFASEKGKNFFLYRVFDFEKRPKLFIQTGTYEAFCKVIPHIFKAYF